MSLRNHVFCILTVLSIGFSSCKKDVATDERIQTDIINSNAAVDDVPETEFPILTELTTTVNSNCAGYLQVLPARYSITTKKYPLIIFLHGIGELGTGVARVKCCGLPSYVAKKLFPAEFMVNGQRFSYIIVAPQFKVRATPANVQSVIDYAVSKYRVDESRIYVTGLSLGGGSTWDYSAVYGQRAAAIVPVCGGTAASSELANSIASKSLPVWTISSTVDKYVPIQWAYNWTNWMQAANPANAANIKLTVYTNGEDHNTTWGKAFNPLTKVDNMNIYEWLLKFKRAAGAIITPPPVPTPGPVPTPTPTPTPVPVPAPGGPNKWPIAMAGSDDAVTLSNNINPVLDGSASYDPDGSVASVRWEKIGGPPTFTIVNANSARTEIVLTAKGAYVFRCVVTDNRGAISTDYKFVTAKL